jgi:hypothetical protein
MVRYAWKLLVDLGKPRRVHVAEADEPGPGMGADLAQVRVPLAIAAYADKLEVGVQVLRPQKRWKADECAGRRL